MVEYNGMFSDVDNVLCMYTYIVRCCRMLLVFSTLVFVTKSSKHLYVIRMKMKMGMETKREKMRCRC